MLTNLTRIDFPSQHYASQRVIDALSHFPRLASLDAQYLRAVDCLSRMHNLRSLHVSDPPADLFAMAGSFLTSLEHLHLEHAEHTFNAARHHFTKLTNITTLQLEKGDLSDKTLAALSQTLTGVRTLSLRWNPPLKDLSAVGRHMASLTNLNLAQCERITDGSIASLKPLRHLARLSIYGTSVTGDGFEGAAYADSLRWLKFCANATEGVRNSIPLSSSGALAIAKLSRVDSVFIHGFLSPAAVQILLSSVQYKKASFYGVSPAVLKLVRLCPTLDSVGVWNTALSPAEAAELKKYLPNLCNFACSITKV